MSVHLIFGWWLAPLVITVLTFGWHFIFWALQPPPSGYGAIGDGLASAITFMAALVVSLVSWLIWALAT